MTAVDNAIERADPSASASDVTQAFRDRYVLAGEVKRLRAQVAAVEALAARREKIASEMAGRMDLDGTRSYLANSKMACEIRAALAPGDEVQAK